MDGFGNHSHDHHHSLQFVDINLSTNIEELTQSIRVIQTLMRRTNIALTWREAFAQHNLILSDRHNYVVTSLDGQIITSVDRQVREHIRKFPVRIILYPVVLEYELPERMRHRGVARISSNHWDYAVSQGISNSSMRYAIPMLPLVPTANEGISGQVNPLQAFSRLYVDGRGYLHMVNDPTIRDPRLDVGRQPINGVPVARIVHSDYQNQMPADLIQAAIAGNHGSHNIRIPLVVQENAANYIAFPGVVLPPQNANRGNLPNAEIAPRQPRVSNRRGPAAQALNLPGPLPPIVPVAVTVRPVPVGPRPPPNEPGGNLGENQQGQAVPRSNEGLPEAADSGENRPLTNPPDEINPEPRALVTNQPETPAQIVNGPEVSVNNGNDMECPHAGVSRRQPSVMGPFANASRIEKSIRALLTTAIALKEATCGRDANNYETYENRRRPTEESRLFPLGPLKKPRLLLSRDRESSGNTLNDVRPFSLQIRTEAHREMGNQERTTSVTSGRNSLGNHSIAAPLAAGENQNGEIDGNNAPENPSGENNQEHGVLTSTSAGTGRNAADTRNNRYRDTGMIIATISKAFDAYRRNNILELRTGIKKLEQLLGYTVADAKAARPSATTGPAISVTLPFANNGRTFENQPMDVDDPITQREIYAASVSSISSESEQNYNINDRGRDSAASNGDNETDSGAEGGGEEIVHNDHNYNEQVHQNQEQHDQENNNEQPGDEEGDNDGAEGNEEIDNNLQQLGNGELPEENANGNNPQVGNNVQVVPPQPENNIEQNDNLRNANLPDYVVEQMRLHDLELVEPPPASTNQDNQHVGARVQGRVHGRYYQNGLENPASRRARYGPGYPVGQYRGRNVGMFNYVGHGAFHPFNRHQGPYPHINGPRGTNPQHIEHSEFCTGQGINHYRQSRPNIQESINPSALYQHAGILYNLANNPATQQRHNVPLVQMPHVGQNQNQDALPNANPLPMHPNNVIHPNPAALADISSYITPLVTRFGLDVMRETANAYYSLRYTSPELWTQLQNHSPTLCEFLSNLFG